MTEGLGIGAFGHSRSGLHFRRMANLNLLPFQKAILSQIHDPQTSDLLLLARGLGLRKLACTLLKIYDSPKSLVLLINASQDEEAAIGEELGIMGCRRPGLRLVTHETPKKDRFGYLSDALKYLS